MAVQPIVIFPDERLRCRTVPVTALDDALHALVQDLADTLPAASAIGLTAPHIGASLRVTAIWIDPGADIRIYVNPNIVWASEERASHEEGSVSMPGIRERVERPAAVRVAFQDLAGRAHEEAAAGFAAAVLQHEIDQLDGIFWLDRLARLRRERTIKRFEKGRRSGAW